MIDLQILAQLNASTCDKRLNALADIAKTTSFPDPVPQYVNNHIHTFYSFSPYSPSAAAYAARMEGLSTAGIIDHDSVSGVREFLRAGEILGMPVTIGMECRVSMAGTPFQELRTNCPDQKGISYITIQSIPHDAIGTVDAFFRPYREARNSRNREMTSRISEVAGIPLNFESDVLPLSHAGEGGSVTERHLMYALANKLEATYGRGSTLIKALAALGLHLSVKQESQLLDTAYPFYAYDLVSILKGAFIPKIYINATRECPLLSDVTALCMEIDALPCYAYLGDVTNSVTGDKAAHAFEDAYLDELFPVLQQCGIRSITYMPTRNTDQQLARVRSLCRQYGMLEVSGEDINSPRQSFIVRKMDDPQFSPLVDSTWRLIRHETEGLPL